MTSNIPGKRARSKAVKWLKLNHVLLNLSVPFDEDKSWQRLKQIIKTGTIAVRCDILEELEDDCESEFRKDFELRPSYIKEFGNAKLSDAEMGIVVIHTAAPDSNRPIVVTIYGMEISEKDIEGSLIPTPQRVPRSPGRPKGAFWPDFAEELAVFAFEEGIADPNASVASVVDRVLDRMSAVGKETPSAAPVRPVVAKVLQRVRT